MNLNEIRQRGKEYLSHAFIEGKKAILSEMLGDLDASHTHVIGRDYIEQKLKEL